MALVFSFDIDGTITIHNQPIEDNFAKLLADMSQNNYLHFISGRTFDEFKHRILDKIKTHNGNQDNIFMSPCLGGALIHLKDSRINFIYEHIINTQTYRDLKTKILQIFGKYKIKMLHYGENFIYKKYLISLSILGRDAPTDIKINYDPHQKKRQYIVHILQKYMDKYDFYIGGTSTIDIVQKGINKAYGLYRLIKYLNISKSDVQYFGDKIIPTGNDYPILQAGFKTFAVSNPEETINKLERLLNN